MAYLETVTGGIVNALNAAGLTAFSEFAMQAEPIPLMQQYVTVGIAELKGETPIDAGDGAAIPTNLKLRLRMHGPADCDPDQLTMLWELYVLPVLLDAGFALGEARLSEIQYNKTLDRLLREATVTMPALLTRSGG